MSKGVRTFVSRFPVVNNGLLLNMSGDLLDVELFDDVDFDLLGGWFVLFVGVV
jgi:hypothetical protein